VCVCVCVCVCLSSVSSPRHFTVNAHVHAHCLSRSSEATSTNEANAGELTAPGAGWARKQDGRNYNTATPQRHYVEGTTLKPRKTTVGLLFHRNQAKPGRAKPVGASVVRLYGTRCRCLLAVRSVACSSFDERRDGCCDLLSFFASPSIALW